MTNPAIKRLKYLVLSICVLAAFGCQNKSEEGVETAATSAKTTKVDSNLKASTTPESVYGPPVDSWVQFRGNDAQGIVEGKRVTSWSDTENVVWKSELPGRGSSSPIVFGDRIFLTSASGYGKSAKEPGKIADLKHHVFCFDAATGQPVWQRDIKGTPLTMRLNENLLRHGFASSTPVTDGKLVYVSFGATGVFAFDFDGNLKWQADIGFGYNYFGSSASLTLHKNLLLVNASIESRQILAIDKESGKGIWRIREIDRSWSMPVVGKTEAGEEELVVMEENFVRGYSPESGKELWHCEGINNYVIATPFINGGVAYCNGGIERQMMAIKLGGKGDVTESHKLWEVPLGANVSSPTILDGQIYLIADNGIFQNFDAKTGKLDQRHRLPTKSRFYASPLLVGDTFYIPLEDNGVYVCSATPDAEKISHNQFDKQKNSLKASFACAGNNLLLRNDKMLYCFGGELSGATNRLADFKNQSELIVPTPRYDFDENTGRIRVYNLYLDHNHETCRRTVLAPYKSVITEDQTTESNKIINAEYQPFLDLRQQQDDAYWAFLQGGSKDHETLLAELKRIDKETTVYADKVRILVKKLFSKEQMDQHLKEAAERHKKFLEQQKKNQK